MGRIRTVKPEFWRHPVISRLPDRTQLLALALLSMSDDQGYFHADPYMVRGDVMPFREDLASISEDLARLSEVGWVALWTHPEQGQMGHVVNWVKHQKIDHPSKSKLETYDIRETLAKESRDTRETLALDQGSRIKDQGSRIKEHEGEKSKRFSPPSVEEVAAYCVERGNDIDPEYFVNSYASKGWMVGKSKMKDWHAAVRKWEKPFASQPVVRDASSDDRPSAEGMALLAQMTAEARAKGMIK